MKLYLPTSLTRLASCAVASVALATAALAQRPAATTVTEDRGLQTAEQAAAEVYLANELARFDTEAGVDVTQVGNGNAAALGILGQGRVNSRATIAQVGVGGAPVDDNVANLVLTGTDNDFSLLQQGNGNVYDGDLRASGAEVGVLQLGDGNFIGQDAQLAPDAGLLLQQDGDNNVLDADGYGGFSGRTVTVRQTGGATAVLRDVSATPR